MRDDSTDLAKAIRRIAERQALRRALERTGDVRAARSREGGSARPVVPVARLLPRGDWDRFLIPGPDEVH